MSLALLLATAATAAVGGAALHTVRGLREEVAALRADRAADRAEAARRQAEEALTALPQQTRGSAAAVTPAAEIRAAVTEALAEERERELAEARAFWAAQEARDAADAPSLLGGFTAAEQESLSYYMPKPAEFTGLQEGELEALLEATRAYGAEESEFYLSIEEEEAAEAEYAAQALKDAQNARAARNGDGKDTTAEAVAADDDDDAEDDLPGDAAELAAARRRHPSHPDFVPFVPHPAPAPAADRGDHDATMARLEGLAVTRAPLSDIRPGPLGTLDVYVFVDGTTLCMTPGHRETAELLAQSLRDGKPPVLLGGSGISGAYALTFSCGEENVYILADRVIASYPA
ncbi:hypothetical protein ACH4SP_30940 [Streptomyces sp. NPDC021093]|uniref:hypothetical protein n=1 Tax=Streptomyces sp. NPDC021093 TaxID=3365112 RepID=UPI0037A554A3